MFHRTPPPTTGNTEEENPFLLSFSDLMASLLAIFILALVVMMIQLHLKQKELDEDRQKVKLSLIELKDHLNDINNTQKEVEGALDGVGLREKSLEGILEGIKQDLKNKGIEVIVTENGSVLRIPEEALTFQSKEHSIQEKYKLTVDLIGEALLLALKKEQNLQLLDTVFIEGHTDSDPYRDESGMGNWGLSTRRAISLWLYWTESPGAHAELKQLKSSHHEDGRSATPLISTSGYADTRPSARIDLLAPGQTRKANPADRRIDIRFTLASSEKKDLSGLKDNLQRMQLKTDEMLRKLEAIK
jgi:flagellar motor protein MotB